jgi:luciferase family oxidoreductase group 1
MTLSKRRYPPVSVLDLVPVTVGSSIAETLRNTRRLAQRAEALGYRRFWLAEHHNAAYSASSATTVLMAYVADGTSTIRIGAGGMMLPNHAPLQIAEQFGTLESLYPGRIDLGVGRGAGADPLAAGMLRRCPNGPEAVPFAAMLDALTGFMDDPKPTQAVRAVPGAGLKLPVWILGAGLASAAFAAKRGLPFAFAGHLRAGGIAESLAAYRSAFQPSAACTQPYAIVSVNAIAADTGPEARVLGSSRTKRLLDAIRGRPLPLQAPGTFPALACSDAEQSQLDAALGLSIQGDKLAVGEQFEQLVAQFSPDEILVNTEMYDVQARMRSYEILAELLSESARPAPMCLGSLGQACVNP